MLNVSSQDCLAREGLLICHASTCSTCRHMPPHVPPHAAGALRLGGPPPGSAASDRGWHQSSERRNRGKGHLQRTGLQVIPGDAKWCQVMPGAMSLSCDAKTSKTIWNCWMIFDVSSWTVVVCGFLFPSVMHDVDSGSGFSNNAAHPWLKIEGHLLGRILIDFLVLTLTFGLLVWHGFCDVMLCSFCKCCSRKSTSTVKESLKKHLIVNKNPFTSQKFSNHPQCAARAASCEFQLFLNVKGRKETKQQESLNPRQIGAGNIG